MRGFTSVQNDLWRLICGSAALALILSGCEGNAPSIFEPHSPRTEAIAELGWILGGIALAVYVIVGGLIFYAIFRRRSASQAEDTGEQTQRMVLLGGGVLPAFILLAAFLLTLQTMVKLRESNDPQMLTIEITAHQWWWEVRYPDEGIVTANEIHIPAGQPVRVNLESADVIHSFWVPGLYGKLDMIPGRTNTLVLETSETGEYRGQCAEYCGLQHAKMLFLVIVESPDDFETWAQQHSQPAAQPDTELEQRGLDVFMGLPCRGCHTIQGTEAAGATGPDLTHLASRQTLGAGQIPNTRPYLATWVTDAQSVKHGVEMPAMDIPADDLEALLAYLLSLE